MEEEREAEAEVETRTDGRLFVSLKTRLIVVFCFDEGREFFEPPLVLLLWTLFCLFSSSFVSI